MALRPEAKYFPSKEKPTHIILNTNIDLLKKMDQDINFNISKIIKKEDLIIFCDYER